MLTAVDLLLAGDEPFLQELAEDFGPEAVQDYVELYNTQMLSYAGFEEEAGLRLLTGKVFTAPLYSTSCVDH